MTRLNTPSRERSENKLREARCNASISASGFEGVVEFTLVSSSIKSDFLTKLKFLTLILPHADDISNHPEGDFLFFTDRNSNPDHLGNVFQSISLARNLNIFPQAWILKVLARHRICLFLLCIKFDSIARNRNR
jgi:hypothetical protein